MVYDNKQIQEILPHAYPFLFVDQVEELEPGVRIRAHKNVTINEPFFQGHFPGYPIMPGVIIIEALAQAGGILGLRSLPDDVVKPLMFFASIDNARFRKPVFPGDTLVLEVTILKFKSGIFKMAGKASVRGETVAEAEFMATMRKREAV
jgi:3-hydroxyacyl-[acyl-carrier-protein] dehydratase